MNTHHRTGRLAVLATTSALGLAAFAVSPAQAETGTHPSGAAATAPDAILLGQTIHIEGTGWTSPDAGEGSIIAVKFDFGDLSPTTVPVIPGTATERDDVWAIIEADGDGSFEVDLPVPTLDNTDAADIADDEAGMADGWAVGESHTINLLSGSLRPGGDTPRGIALDVTIDNGVVISAANGGRGVDPAQVTLTPSAADGSFEVGENISATVDGVAKQWGTTAPTDTVAATASGALATGGSAPKLVFGPAELRAGSHTVVLTGDQGTTHTETVETTPVFSFSSLTVDSNGALTVANLPDGSTVTDLTFGDVEFQGLPQATEESSKVILPYEIPADAVLGTQTATLTLTDPAATYTTTAKISPSVVTVNNDGFDIVETAPGAIKQGLYQSAYGADTDSVFVTTAYSAASDDPDTTSWDGTLYKLDPDTLEIEDQVRPDHVPGEAVKRARFAPYGVATDDERGTVWVTNTRQNTVAVYDQTDLSLVKQFPIDTTNHTREVLVDPATDKVFVTSANRGATSTPTIVSVFDAVELEKIEDVQVGTNAADFVPMALTLDEATGKVYTPSLTTSEVAEIDTTTLDVRNITLEETISSGSGIDVDSATGHLFIASQGTDNLLIADAGTGATIKDVPTGSGALAVEIDAVNGLAYTANFTGGSTISVTDLAGTIKATLPFVSPNHVATDGQGSVYAVNKAANNQVIKITPKAVTPGTPAISGTARVGRTLTAIDGEWSEGADLTYQWLRNGVAIPAATKKTYTTTVADYRRNLSVRVTGTNGVLNAAATSAARPVAAGILVAPTPRITGKAKVRKPLIVSPGRWTSGTRLAYRWYANGRLIRGATKARFVLTKAQKGKRITVTVTGTKSGYTTVTKRSAATAKVRR